MKKAIADSDAESKQKQSELSELVSEREKKCAELDAMKVGENKLIDGQKQILEIEEKMKTCEEKEASLHADAEKEAKKIEGRIDFVQTTRFIRHGAVPSGG